MNYDQYLTIAARFGFTDSRRDQLARTALLPYAPRSVENPYLMPNLRSMPVFAAHPEILRVPKRRLKRWATRAVKAGVPRAKRLTGPALAIHRRGTMHPSLRAFMP